MNVYVIECNGKHKIGFARDIPKRLSRLQQGNAEQLTVVSGRTFDNSEEAHEHERFMHKKLEDYYVRGEWYSASLSTIEAYLYYGFPKDVVSYHAKVFRGLAYKPRGPMGRPSGRSKLDKDLIMIQKLLDLGVTQKKICEKLGCTAATLSNWIKKKREQGLLR